MAKVKFSALVSDMRNKLNGSVFSKNRSGSYLRNKVTPVNPQTTFQTNVRAQFTALAQNWRGLTEGQRLTWASQVDSYKKTDIFGDLKSPSALNLYMRLNGNLGAVNVAPMSICPVAGDTPEISDVAVTGDLSSTALTISTSLLAVPAGVAYILDATKPLSAGKNFVKSEYRQIGVLDSAEVLPYNAWADYIAKYGAPAVGQKVFIRLTPIDKVTGLRGQAISASCIIAA